MINTTLIMNEVNVILLACSRAIRGESHVHGAILGRHISTLHKLRVVPGEFDRIRHRISDSPLIRRQVALNLIGRCSINDPSIVARRRALAAIEYTAKDITAEPKRVVGKVFNGKCGGVLSYLASDYVRQVVEYDMFITDMKKLVALCGTCENAIIAVRSPESYEQAVATLQILVHEIDKLSVYNGTYIPSTIKGLATCALKVAKGMEHHMPRYMADNFVLPPKPA